MCLIFLQKKLASSMAEIRANRPKIILNGMLSKVYKAIMAMMNIDSPTTSLTLKFLSIITL